MIIILKKSRIFLTIVIVAIILLIFIGMSINKYKIVTTSAQIDSVETLIIDIFDIRNLALLEKDLDVLEYLYNKNKKYGLWAYEHELKKMKYLHMWSEKQGIQFIDVDTKIKIKNIQDKELSLQISIIASTEYKYVYIDEPNKVNMFRIGTYHLLNLEREEDKWLITRDWYTDPFADSLNLDQIKSKEVKKYITSQNFRDLTNVNERRKKAIEYADKFCGAAADEEYDYKYNEKYKNYNHLGGDCANFASQMLYEGGGFKKTYSWNYVKDGSKAWVNAQAFKSYMVYSGRASVIARGTYQQVYKMSNKLLPGDFVAYEKKGKITHISVISGADSKGYSLVNSHNTDRYRVPWDLGWSDKNIKFWLVRVHY